MRIILSGNSFKDKKKEDVVMKKMLLCAITIPVFICLLTLAGCATTAKMAEPTGAGSTLLIGRIKATLTNFPAKWHINGDHTDGIMVKIKSDVTNETRFLRVKGDDGLFYFTDPGVGTCTIVGFQFQKRVLKTKIELVYGMNDPINIRGNAVNNVGDISWRCKYVTSVSTEFSRKGSYTSAAIDESHMYKENYAEVKSWFEKTYPASAWNNRNWVNAR